MNPLTRAAIRYPRRTLAALAVLTALALPGLPRLELRTEGWALAPREAPALREDRKVRAGLGFRDPLAVVLHTSHPSGIYNPGTLGAVRDLTDRLARLPAVGPADLLSLATEPGFRTEAASLQRRKLLDPFPRTPAELGALRRDVERIGLYSGTLVSTDRRSTAVYAGVPPGARHLDFYRTVREAAARLALPPGDRLEILGAPVAEALLGSHILADLGLPPRWLGVPEEVGRPGLGLILVVFAVLALVFWLSFRRVLAVLLPLLKVGSALLIVFGVMGWLGVPLYLPSAVLPVVLVAVGIAEEIHLFRRYLDLTRAPEGARLGNRERVAATYREMESPVLQASLTTAVGFLSFAFSPLPPIQAFGLFTAFGVLLQLLSSLTVTAAWLVLLPAGRLVRPAPENHTPGTFSRRWAAGMRARRRTVLAVAAAGTGLALLGLLRLEVQDSWIDSFSPQSGLARAMRRFDRQFHGAHLLLVAVDGRPRTLTGLTAAVADHRLTLPRRELPEPPSALVGSTIRFDLPGRVSPFAPAGWSAWIESATVSGDRVTLSWPLAAGSPSFQLQPDPGERLRWRIEHRPFAVPALLRRVEDLEAFLARQPGVGGVLGPAAYLKTASFLTTPDRPGSRSLPESPEALHHLWHNYGAVRGTASLRRLVDAEFSQTLVTVFLRHSNYLDTGRLMRAVRAYEARVLHPAGLHLGFAGDVAVSQAMIGALVSSQLRSLGFSLLGIFAVTALFGRSWRWGAACVLPPALAIAANFGILGWAGIPLGIATSLFSSIVLGTGVDYAIHLLARFRRSGGNWGEALATAGPAILIDVLSVGLGFAVLLFSSVPANSRFAGLILLSLAVSLAATFTLLPAWVGARFLRGRQPTAGWAQHDRVE